ncbi:hypothetical protein Pyn_37398 [Prunus yedoensis var. nudiflora]|uniref:Uncharacterized protein n=1 Tax=Prunus yedoensis var. nudiflora TaxID=2094558 RepID=A0A314XXC5_PRUYE|nr:hypothetical protein Pyn_37398 [Prunus yedoensis var. nudiflora]
MKISFHCFLVVEGFEHEEKGDFATSPKHFKNKACHCPCYCCGTEPVYMYRSCGQHRMLNDFEGATRKNEVGFRIWTSKEGTFYLMWITIILAMTLIEEPVC